MIPSWQAERYAFTLSATSLVYLAALVDEDFHLGFAHAHERELGGDEESVHEQEEKDKKKA